MCRSRDVRRLPCFVGGAIVLLVGAGSSGTATAQTTKTFIDYFQPTPTACPVTSQTWGVSAVLPRDICNGLEAPVIPPTYYYWDGKVIRAKDGKYHMFADRWPNSKGFDGWGSSQTIHAVSDTLLGTYVDKGYAFDKGPDAQDPHKGHNVSACELPDGTYCLFVNEIVPFTMFTSPSLDGPWTNKGHVQIDTNGVTVQLCGDTHLESNVSLVVRPDGQFEIVQRHGIIAIATSLTGPYKVQKPTNTYPQNQQPPATFPTIYPYRKTHLDSMAPATVEDTCVNPEDPVIWYSGGQYHVLYDYPNDRVGYHLTSPDGIHNWTDQGLAYDPRWAQKLFSSSDGTVNHWYKMERPGVIMADGHITHFTFAVSDVDKNYGNIAPGSNHGSKVIVMAFDGEAFDADTGIGGTGGTGAGGSSGSTGAGGRGGSGGSSSGGTTGGLRDGSAGAGGSTSSGGGSGTAGAGGSAAGGSGSGGGGARSDAAAGGSIGGMGGASSANGGAQGGGTSGSKPGMGGFGGTVLGGSGGSAFAHGGSSGSTAADAKPGCSCRLGAPPTGFGRFGLLGVFLVGALLSRRRGAF
jgi:hypothetical protein